MRAIWRLLTFGFFSALVLSYQNCGKFDVGSNSSRSQANGLCIGKLRSEPNAAVIQLRQENPESTSKLDCADLNAYVCDRRIYAPDVGTGQTRERSCGEISSDRGGDLRDFCVTTNIFSFDTSGRKADPEIPASAFASGGEYNFESTRCYHTGLELNGIAVLGAEADSLPDALAKAIDACQRGLQ